jgi:hypothetical protein
MQTAKVNAEQSRLVPYREAVLEIRDGDILLWRATSLVGRAIARRTKSKYSHAAMARFMRGRLWTIEMLQWYGGRADHLESQVRRWPGACDVFRPYPIYNGDCAAWEMDRLVGQDYGWADFAYITFHRLGLDPRHIPNSDEPEQPRVCSAGVAWAARTGGRRIVRGDRTDMEIVPGDLADEDFSRYLLTLVP